MVVWGVATAVSIVQFSRMDETVEADAAIVLGAAVFGNEPSPIFRERINHAIYLYESGLVQKIIFTGGHDDDGRVAESLVAKEYALKKWRQ